MSSINMNKYTIDDLFSSYPDADEFKAKVLRMFPNLALAGGDGSSYENAVKIEGISNPFGVPVIEKRLLSVMGLKGTGHQYLNVKDGRRYDVLQAYREDGKLTEIYFDIT